MFICNLDGKMSFQPEEDGRPASVGMVCAWGGFTIAEISSEVPMGERDDWAQLFKSAPELLRALKDAAQIIKKDANTEENYGSLCRLGELIGRLK
jgi:hypothetical protein